MPFNFQMITIPWTPLAIHRAVAEYEEALPDGAWPNWVLGNHDRSRIATRIGPAQARVAAVLLLTLRGTPTLYYGDELGMVDVDVPKKQQTDPQGMMGGESRDPVRTPMRWDASSYGGFTKKKPWLPMGPDVESRNVASRARRPGFHADALYRRLLELRRREPALNVGDWHDLGRNKCAVAYLRSDGDRRILVAANLTSSATPVPMAAHDLSGEILLCTTEVSPTRQFDGQKELAPNEAVVVLLD